MSSFFKGDSKNKHTSAGRWALFLAALAALGVVFVFVFVINWGMTSAKKEKYYSTGTFLSGISIDGEDVSGKTIAEVQDTILAMARQKLEDTSARFRVGGTIFKLSGSQLGALVDYQSVMEEAMLYGRGGSILQNMQSKKAAEAEGVNFDLPVVLDTEVLATSLSDMSGQFNATTQDAQARIDTYTDEDKLTVRSELVFTDEVVGRVVDQEELKESIIAAVKEGVSDRVILASWEETQPKVTKKDLEETCQRMASYTTEFKDSTDNRIYNIWKMSTVVTGLVLQPGESWSINGAAGDRTLESGWKDAPGIKNGEYVMEPGGGICQVSSTLYAALISAEVNVTDRSHHSWPMSYIPTGMDATISTGSPDLVFQNNYDKPIMILVKCDGSDTKSITVEVYGPPLGYSITFETEVIKNEEPDEDPVTVVDNTLAAGESKWNKPRHNLIVANLWKIKKDKTTGEEIGERELFSVETYKAYRGELAVGPS